MLAKLVVKEAICVHTIPENSHFNHDSGYDIPDWKLRGGTHAKL